MSRHLKNIVIDGLSDTCATFVSLPPNSTPHTKGVRYLVLSNLFTEIRGAMNDLALGSKRRKHIIIRPSRFRKGLHELYTYHFPTHWSAACVANRELIKEAQRQAHALEHDYSFEGLEWRLRFFKHYFNVFRRHEDPAPGLKRYSRFYQYTYVCIYRALQDAAKAAQEESARLASSLGAPNDNSEVDFEPIEPDTILSRPVKIRSSIPLQRLFDQKSVPRFAFMQNLLYLCSENEFTNKQSIFLYEKDVIFRNVSCMLHAVFQL